MNASDTNLSTTAAILSQNREIMNNVETFYADSQTSEQNHNVQSSTPLINAQMADNDPPSIKTILQSLNQKWTKIEQHL